MKGCGPAWSRASGMTAYQKRRSTGCLVTSIAAASGHDLEVLDEAGGVGLLPVGVGLEQAGGDHELVGLFPARIGHDARAHRGRVAAVEGLEFLHAPDPEGDLLVVHLGVL